MTDRKTPPHMRDNPSDDEYDFADASASETGAGDTGSITSETISKEGKVPGGSMGKGGDMGVKTLEKILKRKAQVGEVEIDPQIDYTDFTEEGPGLSSRAAMTDEGMINIWVDLKQSVPDLHKDYAVPVKEYGTDPSGGEDCPPLNIVIFIVGSRGDVQPYLALALSMIRSHGHRIRIATHPDFKDFVLDVAKRLKGAKGKNGQDLEGRLEFFDIGGDPKALMAYMVKNPGLLPGWASLTNGDVNSKRKMTSTMLHGFFQSIYSPDPVTSRPFAADAIISNPPAFAHCHIAEAFGLPLHMTFTMPWSPSTAFNHPLVNIKQSNAEKGLTNVLTFSFADMMTWQGLGDIINAFRSFTLGLEPLSVRTGPSILDRLKVPWTYCWSEGLIPKPDDWKAHIDISGFYFLEGDTDFKPDDELAKFLEDGEAPVYIGFGSVVVEDAAAMTQTIFDAVRQAGVRALVSAGWGGLGGTEVPDGVFILKGNVPHDWLFADGRISAVCHHGAGTTAIGLRNGLPTIVVPFFGDQKFWGEMVHRAAAGPAPIPHKELTAENLSAAIRYAVSKEAKVAAGRMGERIRAEKGEEKGEEKGVKSFHKHLPLKTMRCDLQPNKTGGWWYPRKFLRLSGAAGIVLEEAGKLKLDDLEPLRAKEYQPRWRSKDIKTEGTSAILMALSSGAMSSMFDPARGATTLATTMPQGVVDLFSGVHSGFDMIPGKIGSDVRERGKIDGLVSGVREAGKGLAYGWWDGITGLATEPIKGGQKEGALGVLKGMGRSYINVWARPAAGITGAFALPLQGAYLSMRRKVSGTPSRLIREPRIGLSHLEAASMSPEEKNEIVRLFEQADKHTDERRGYYKRKTEVYLQNMKKEKASSDTEGNEKATEQEEGFLLKDGDDVGYIQEGDLRQMSEEERGKMAKSEKEGYERARKEFDDEHERHVAGL